MLGTYDPNTPVKILQEHVLHFLINWLYMIFLKLSTNITNEVKQCNMIPSKKKFTEISGS